MKEIRTENLELKLFDIWKNQWLLITAGDFEKNDYNTMTIAWGSFGVMWNKPFVQAVVRPTRYTYEFTNKYDNFTITAFPEEYKKALQLLGTKSGKNCDKIKESGLTPIKSELISSPAFAEANLIMECKKIYWQDIQNENFLDPTIEKSYPLKDYHRIYFGEILKIFSDYK